MFRDMPYYSEITMKWLVEIETSMLTMKTTNTYEPLVQNAGLFYFGLSLTRDPSTTALTFFRESEFHHTGVH
jgi:hypothetical protein